MTPAVYRVFESICAAAPITGAVLEVGAVPGPDSLLKMPCLRNAAQRVGINLDKAWADDDSKIVQGNANHMDCFADGQFDAVLCNATLEHDPYFWKTITEIHRVSASGALIVIGVPGFAGMGPGTFVESKSMWRWMLAAFAKVTKNDVLQAGTVTLGEHLFPGDYYRFSEQAVRDIFLGGLHDVSTAKVMNPPRIIGWGRKA
ncbi:MAG: methyltransferase domain-containing protein [Pseudomonadota bacterium]